MANGKVHTVLGMISGPSLCLLLAQLDGRKATLPELLGASMAGGVSAKLPDWLEPAIHPHHRSFFHSCSFAATVGTLSWSFMLRQRREFLRLADQYEQLGQLGPQEGERAAFLTRTWGYQFLAGILTGAIAGYASHLIADACTAKSLPFFA